MSCQPTSNVLSTLLSPAEELANRITHGIGLLLSLVGVAVMVTVLGNGDGWRVAGCSLYLASLIAVYAMSTLSHTFLDPRRRSLFRALDQGVNQHRRGLTSTVPLVDDLAAFVCEDCCQSVAPCL